MELKEALEVVQANEQEAKRLHATGERVLKQVIVEKKPTPGLQDPAGRRVEECAGPAS